MKANTTELVKFLKLQRRLRESKRGTVGLLELLWKATAQQAPRGDIGRFSNEDIAALVDWDGDADLLVTSLVETGWLDVSKEHRLIVHDWKDHAPVFVRGNLERSKKTFCVPDPPCGPYIDPSENPEGRGSDPEGQPSEASSLSSSLSTSLSTDLSSSLSTVLPSQAKPSLVKPSVYVPAKPANTHRQKRFVKPTPEEVDAYCREKGYEPVGERFCNFYESKGWRVGKSPMQNWKSAVSGTWANSSRGKPATQEQKFLTVEDIFGSMT